MRLAEAVPIIGLLTPESQDAKPHSDSDRVRRSTDAKAFSGVERRRYPDIAAPATEPTEVNLFHELGKALTSSLQLDQVLRTIMEKINEVLHPDTWSLLLMDRDKQELFFQIATGAGAEALKDVRIKVGQGLAGWVAQSGEAVVVADTSRDSRFFAQVSDGKVSKVTIVGSVVHGYDTSGSSFRVVVPANRAEMMAALQQHGVEVWFKEAPEQSWPNWLLNLAPLVLLAALWFLMIRRIQKGSATPSGTPVADPRQDSQTRFGR